MPNPFLAIARKNAAVSRVRNIAAGAQFSRLTNDWIRSATSIDLEVRSDIRVLRSRARTLVRDNEHARAVVRVLATNIIGAHGIKPVPMNFGADGSLAKKANDKIVAAWAEWSHPDTASTDTRYAFPEIERQVMKGVVTDGEAIVRIWDGFDNAFGFALEVIDPDLLDEQYNRGEDQSGNRIVMGIEVDRFNRPVTYWLWKRHPSETSFRTNERIPVPAAEIIHLFVPLRPGQTRGISWFAPVMLNAKMLAGYTEAALVAARTAAAQMGFFTTMTGEDDEPPPVTGEKLVMEAEPGVATQLPAGMSFTPWDPKQPSSAYDTFVTAILRAQAAGMGVSYATLTGDLTKVNYSSSRIGQAGERDEFEISQVWIAGHFHRRIYRAWLPIALLTEFLSLPSYDARRWLAVRWQGRRWAEADPLKAIAAVKEEIALGVNSRQSYCRSQGRDWETVMEEQSHENELAKTLKVDISGAAVTIKEAAPANDSEEGEEGDGEDTPPASDAKSSGTKSIITIPNRRDARARKAVARLSQDVLAELAETDARISRVEAQPAPSVRVNAPVHLTVESPKGTMTRQVVLKRANGEELNATITESLTESEPA